MKNVVISLAISAVIVSNGVAAGKPGADQSKQVKTLVAEFEVASDEAGRKAAFDKMLALGESAVGLISPLIDGALKAEERRYARLLEPRIRRTYIKRLECISDEQVSLILQTRALWEPYILNGGSDPKFREVYLGPIWKMKEFLLLKITDIEDTEVVTMRRTLVEYAGYRTQCHKVLKISPDPTVGKLSPTGIEYAHLDQPPTFIDKLHHYERTLILINTVASKGAREVLLMADQAARKIDVEEAEYVMAANEVRMLAGSIAWRADPLGCAVERDHSTDRKEGRAKGHMSEVPGKRGFGDRNKRMGAGYYGSEGAGGGRNGPAYLRGLSYSGAGHGGPLYGLGRNRVGVGRRGGVYTSQYATDKKYIHPCPATEHEMWMPPGVAAGDLRDPAIQQAYRAMKSECYGSAWKMLDRAKAPTGSDAIALRFFRAAIDVKVQQSIGDILATEGSGDVFFARIQLHKGLAGFKGIDAFETAVAAASQRLEAKDLRTEMRAGEAYYRLYYPVKDAPKDKFNASRRGLIERLGGVTRKYKDSIYGKAAEDAAKRLADPESDASALMAFFKERRNPAGRSTNSPESTN